MLPRDPNRPGFLFWLACAVALALRLSWLDLRPLHHDEALNASLLFDLVAGSGYRYNPNAYHGPLLYLLGWPVAALFGPGTVPLRLPVALASAGMIPLLLPLRQRLGRSGITAAAWLLALSPSLVYYGRDLIHETYLTATTLGLVGAGSLWLTSRRRRDLLLASGALALLFAIKETAILGIAGVALAAIATRLLTRAPARDPEAGELFPGDGAPDRRPPLALPSQPDLAWAVAVFVAVWIAAFTTLFTHAGGLADSLRAYLPWLRKGVGGAQHGKPWSYFAQLLWSFEAPIFLGALGAGTSALWRRCFKEANDASAAPELPRNEEAHREQGRRDRFSLFCALWAGAELLLYSAIPYKTPWLMLNMVVPGALAAAALFGSSAKPSSRMAADSELATGGSSARARRGLTGLLLVALAWSGCRAGDAAFRRYDDPGLGLVYSDTRREVWELLAYVRGSIAARAEPGAVTLDAYLTSRWPLPWYLRDLPQIRWRHEVERIPKADLILSDRGQRRALLPLLPRGYTRRAFLLRPNAWVDVWVRRGNASAE